MGRRPRTARASHVTTRWGDLTRPAGAGHRGDPIGDVPPFDAFDRVTGESEAGRFWVRRGIKTRREGEHGLQRRSAGGQGRRGDSPPGSGDRTAHGGGRKLLACPPGDGGRQGQGGEFARPRGTGGARARVCQVGGVGSRVTAEVVAVGRLAFRRRKRRRAGQRRERSEKRSGGGRARGEGERREKTTTRLGALAVRGG